MPAYPFRAVRQPGQAPSAGQLWKRVSAERRQIAARAFWTADDKASSVEAMVELARALKFRPKSVQAMPLEKKIRHLASIAALSDAVAGQVLVAYHLAHQRPMMGAFLDALGIAHDDGVISAPDTLEPPEPAALAEAVEKLFAAYPADDVELYLSTLAVQDVATWGGVIDRLVARAGDAEAPAAKA